MQEKPISSTPYEAALFAAELGGAPEIDLHGLDTNLALNDLDAFLHAELMRGTEVVRVIHGRGEQKLRDAVWKWLKKMNAQDLVAAFRDTNNPSQQGAVTLVALHRLAQ